VCPVTWTFLDDPELRRNLLATGTLIFALILSRFAVLRTIRNMKVSSDAMRRRWTASVRNLVLIGLGLGVMVIWASELQAFAVSVVAIAAAIVLATKELIMCVSGSILRATSGSFAIGDRVEMGGVRGDVIDSTLLSTTLLEVGPGHQRTGRAVVVPNSVMLSGGVTNETFMDRYVVHVMTLPIKAEDDWRSAEETLLAVANDACADFVEPARAFMDRLSDKHSLPKFSVEPRVLVAMPKAGELELVLRVPTPVRERGRTEQRILRTFLERRRGDAAVVPPREDADTSLF